MKNLVNAQSFVRKKSLEMEPTTLKPNSSRQTLINVAPTLEWLQEIMTSTHL